MRDDKADAMSGLPVGLRLLRPDGIEVEKRQLTGIGWAPIGKASRCRAMRASAPGGSSCVSIRKRRRSAAAEFRVEDFVPPQLKVELAAADGPIRPGEAFPVDVAARYYYGAPGAGLAIEAEAVIALDDNPFPMQPGFQFGLVDEEFTGDRRDIEAPSTDENGKARLSVALNDLPDLTRPLAATIRVGVFEPSGRAVYETVTRPIRQRPVAIGLRSPAGDDAVPEGAEAKLEVIAVDPQGSPIAAKGLRFELLRETWEYRWYSVNGVWRHKSHIRSQPIDAGTLDVAADSPASLARQLPAGRYRWEVTDPASGAQSSLQVPCRLVGRGRAAGCPGQARGGARQTELPAGRDRQAVRQGAVCRPGRAGDRLRPGPLAARAEPAGGRHHARHPGRRLWGSGVYALVSAYRPSDAGTRQGRNSADPGGRSGSPGSGSTRAPAPSPPALAAPDVVRPRSPVEIPVKVAGLAAGEEAYVTLAAVDEAVLKLTEFDSPAPEKYYYGKRQLGVELRDLYGRLIDARANAVGVLRSGGDSFAKRSVAGLPDKSSKVVALFSGIVRLDRDGAARIPFRHPGFPGPAAADGGRVLGAQGRLRRPLDDGARSGRDDGVAAALSRSRAMPRGSGVTINNLEGRGRRLSPDLVGEWRRPVHRRRRAAR